MTTTQAFKVTQHLLESQYDTIKSKRYKNISKKTINKNNTQAWTQGYADFRFKICNRTRIETEEVKDPNNKKKTIIKVKNGEHNRIHFDGLYYDRGYGSMATLNQKFYEINKYDDINGAFEMNR
jgi:hypothetical protein